MTCAWAGHVSDNYPDDGGALRIQDASPRVMVAGPEGPGVNNSLRLLATVFTSSAIVLAFRTRRADDRLSPLEGPFAASDVAVAR